jgi:hypothetical protein
MRQALERLQGSLIREIANGGMGRADVPAFWFGESDEVTSEGIRQGLPGPAERPSVERHLVVPAARGLPDCPQWRWTSLPICENHASWWSTTTVIWSMPCASGSI